MPDPTQTPELIQTGVDLTHLNTMALKVSARFYAKATNATDIQRALGYAHEHQLPLFILGGGSNIIFTGDYPGLVLHMAEQGIDTLAEDSNSITVRVAAGMHWDNFLQTCLNNSWYGLENLAIIPGTVGAAPVQNIGAYGQEVADCIDSVDVINLHTREPTRLAAQVCEFAYRDSIFKSRAADKYLITHVAFRFSKTPAVNISYGPLASHFAGKTPTPAAIRDAVISIRQSKLPDPAEIANTGSFFKNPMVSNEKFAELRQRFIDLPAYPQSDGRVKLAAGWLIEKAGFKGKRYGPVGMYEKQALVLVNHDGATCDDILQLVKRIIGTVQQDFDVLLEPEPVFVNTDVLV
ncbi:UDP-N-acetylenolpyruvoylglucosamine reductase [BD1-7 clade bacterium]|uniref:UDP-N-acetylenolpyruvoylglucosamine reductase n=1 Tax=BD1-7 clade bacterium TaxID=2029982 RepID=A0A5S9P2G7_9GAMM|nr:UDP-N-acetylenolpyruvoylglucosamine reductase [BD1-7 clade bacterium]CAA0122769.1 UDP-N-acetylenolpyruvoylglucosamine reductase [BD1-7 clade bacterium]